MMKAAGVIFSVHVPSVDEDEVQSALIAEGATPARIADALAELKAVTVSRRAAGLVLGADQILVTSNGICLDKPGDRDAAGTQLRRLAGTEHLLIAAAVIAENGAAIWRASDTARLTMRHLSDSFIADYLEREGEAVMGCVGTYRIEGLGAQLFTKVTGDPFVIQGLPLLSVLSYLRTRGELAA